MDEEKFALVEKILKDVDNIMSKNAELCEFDIVPMETNFQNKSPVLYLENCLGLESWCVKHVYMYCYSELMDKCVVKSKWKSHKLSTVDSDRLIRLLNVTLLLNPALSTLWNRRRDMVLKQVLDKSKELRFTRLVLSQKPKCNDAFAYRRWLLEAIFQDETLQCNYMDTIVNEELNICELTSERSPNNYHSWNHRTWLINRLKNLTKQYNLNSLYIREYNFSERFTSRHISDFSCFHYRQFCIKNIFQISHESWKNIECNIDVNLRKSFVRTLAENFPKDVTVDVSEENLTNFTEENLVKLLLSYVNKNCNCTSNDTIVCRKLEMLFHELCLNDDMLRLYTNYETLWYHRRFVTHEILSIIYDYYGIIRRNGVLVKNTCRSCCGDVNEKQVKIVRYDGARVYSSLLFNVLVSHEKRFVEERRTEGDNYADRHEKYLKFVEGLNNVQ